MWFVILFILMFVLVAIASIFRKYETEDIPGDTSDVPPFGIHAFLVVVAAIIFIGLTIYVWAFF